MGYMLVNLDFIAPKFGLTNDQQVKCLAYLIRRFDDLLVLPGGLKTQIIPVEYLGGPYPCIGVLFTENPQHPSQIWDANFEIEERLNAYVEGIGIEQLLELSSQETLNWDGIIEQFRQNQ